MGADVKIYIGGDFTYWFNISLFVIVNWYLFIFNI